MPILLHRSSQSHAYPLPPSSSDNATAYVTRAVKDLKELTGGTSIEYTGALNTLALISLAKNDYKGAVDIFQKIVDIRLDVYGFAHEAFALASNNLGVALMVAGELEKGGDMLRKTITNRELIFGKGSQMVGKGLSNLSVVYRHAFNAYTATQLNATRMQQDVKVVKVEGPSNYFPSIMSAFTRKKDKNKDSDKNHDKDKNEDKGKNNDKNKEKDRRGSMSSAQSRQSKAEEEGRNLGLRGITLSEIAQKITKSHTDFLSSLLDTIPGEYEAHLMHLDDMQEQLLQSSAARKESLRNVAFLDS